MLIAARTLAMLLGALTALPFYMAREAAALWVYYLRPLVR
jgi:hypothetical protein